MDALTIIALIVSSSLFAATPLIFTALGGVFSEKSGVVNIGLEGLMIIGAFTAIVFNLTFVDTFGDMTPWVSLLAAMLAGGLLSLLHGVASIAFRADQVVSGVAINFLALGLSLFLVKLIYDKGQTDMIDSRFIRKDIPFLSDIPVIGDIFFSNIARPTIWAFVIAFVSWFVLYKTPFGLRLRSVGEHPMAADTMGVNVAKIRYIAVFLSGVLGGLGGAVYAQSISLDFSHSTITGQGFMALAAMIFGKWHPLGAMGAAIFFGFAQSLSIVGTSIPFLENVPAVYLLIAPYVLTILALAGFIGRADAPKASGTPYIKGSR
ncbi:ABC transporter permease [Domibacillus enclensis]|uniref:ABC transporter permease n=1 Tax=Domibacillus enclensis TaxID=1017273 RepID=A0A1N6URW3_9BACI|nr:ABC transporter permease [Domibacillus enclensis]OXS78606.1 ABC transporter permease [Domibacillus enclensis]SIQ68374.1 nucleoside ABC transporter membrane protein [Domibacillus enclensis]